VDFWRVGMGCLVAANVAWLLRGFAPPGFGIPIELAIGVLAFAGFAGSIINGMLYKIVPFLAWFHAQALAADIRSVPNVREMLGQSAQRRQFAFHVLALVLLLCSTAWPSVLVYPAALALGASAVLLELNLLKVARAYKAIPVKGHETTRVAPGTT
jgi:hypothetical protein